MATPVKYHLGHFPPKSLDWERLVPLLGPAHAGLADYNGTIKGIPNPSILLSPLLTREAVLSSKIEGTNITLGEVLAIEAGGDDVSQSKRDDAEEVLNYRKALSFAAEATKGRTFSLHLLREAHELLMQGVRGQDKGPGAFRETQNWIGKADSTIEEASFIPIAPEQLPGGMEHWAEYFKGDGERDKLVQLAILHVEFEALHPFMDGNGRMGRMIIPLFLREHGILKNPSFYMSGYLEARREQYIEAMSAVSGEGAWTDWCVFFLQGIIEQAAQNQSRAEAVLELYRQMRRTVAEITRSQYADLAVDFIFSRPIFTTSDFAKKSGIAKKPTAVDVLNKLRNAEPKILETVRESSGSQPAMFEFTELLQIVE